MTTNDNKPWGTIKQTTADEVPPARVTIWFELYEEVRLRLEQTPKAWLEIPFEDQRTRNAARNALMRHANRRIGDRSIETRGITRDGQSLLFVRRGKNWKK